MLNIWQPYGSRSVAPHAVGDGIPVDVHSWTIAFRQVRGDKTRPRSVLEGDDLHDRQVWDPNLTNFILI